MSMTRLSRLLLSAAMTAAVVLAVLPGRAAASDASAAVPKNTDTFRKLHESFLARKSQGPIGLLFLGDSITARWRTVPGLWQQDYGKYDPANFGISGDTTQNVIWRIENGELDGIHPKVVVLMLGTNNTKSNTGEEIAAADAKIFRLIQEKVPGVKVLLLAIFPRGPRTADKNAEEDAKARMAVIRAANDELLKLDNGKTVRFLDIGSHFLDANGSIPDDVMADHLHPTTKGLKIWAEAMNPTLLPMLAN
jgi:lysophospholipase L1-like esterase